MVDQKKEEKVNTIDLRKVIVRFVFTVLFMATVLFLSAGTLKWLEGWIYMGTSLVLLLGSRYILITKFPETAAERMNAGKKEDTQPWDKVIVPIVAIYLPMLTWVVAGLEKRFGLSANLPLWVQILGIGLYFAGSVFSNWAMFHNRFFSSHVRIQKDRGHEVVKDGPYAWVRHPGYAGGFLAWLVTPMFFNSWLVLVPSLVTCALFVVRILKEEETLAAELVGYKEYTQEVKYRVFPGFW